MNNSDILVDFDTSVGRWIGSTAKMVDNYLHEAFQSQGLDLSKEQMIVLKKLHENDGLIQNELAYLTLRDKSSLARLLAKMERKNYITREQDEFDKRVNRVFITETGRTTFRLTRPIIVGLKEIMEKDIKEEEIYQLTNTLKSIQRNISSEEAQI
ncbi:MarR family transcriptional regulator [uncultured Eudoraea sp.]|uniref:MarR family winged helix-turn-helix transcriptional regulator n=1 Tax=uncultured Eudoraea sp. TaxID=1035614 RepID=UPI00261386DB|nr:MarR family transcriptional regulator [uncultured Eudoraea sp.]